MKICNLGKNACHISFNMIMWLHYFLIELHFAKYLTAKTPNLIGSHFTMQEVISDQLIGGAF